MSPLQERTGRRRQRPVAAGSLPGRRRGTRRGLAAGTRRHRPQKGGGKSQGTGILGAGQPSPGISPRSSPGPAEVSLFPGRRAPPREATRVGCGVRSGTGVGSGTAAPPLRPVSEPLDFSFPERATGAGSPFPTLPPPSCVGSGPAAAARGAGVGTEIPGRCCRGLGPVFGGGIYHLQGTVV